LRAANEYVPGARPWYLHRPEPSVESIEKQIQAEHPEVKMLFVKPQSHRTWLARLRQIEKNSIPAVRKKAERRRAVRDKVS